MIERTVRGLVRPLKRPRFADTQVTRASPMPLWPKAVDQCVTEHSPASKKACPVGRAFRTAFRCAGVRTFGSRSK